MVKDGMYHMRKAVEAAERLHNSVKEQREVYKKFEEKFMSGTPIKDLNTKFDQYGMHETITKEMSKIYREKNADYGDSFHKSVDKHGLIAAVVRLDDKMQRIDNIVKTEKVEVKTESLEDTLLDMANYAIMTVIELRRKAWK